MQVNKGVRESLTNEYLTTYCKLVKKIKNMENLIKTALTVYLHILLTLYVLYELCKMMSSENNNRNQFFNCMREFIYVLLIATIISIPLGLVILLIHEIN